MSKLLSWREIPLGGMIPWPGNTRENDMSSWRVLRPVIDQDKCIRCRICWSYCPDAAIEEVDEPYVTSTGRRYPRSYRVNYRYCKGCGICANECPVKAIKMVPEVR